MIKKGDVVWCWERTPDDFKFGGFLAIVSCKPSHGMVNVIKDTPAGPQQRTLLLRDVEKYCNKTDYEAEEIIINTAQKFKTLNPDEKKKMLKNISMLRSSSRKARQENSLTSNFKEPIPDPFSMPDEWNPGNCKNFEECWCGACGES